MYFNETSCLRGVIKRTRDETRLKQTPISLRRRESTIARSGFWRRIFFFFFHFSCFPLTGRTDAQCGCLKNFGRSTRLLSLSKAAAAAAASFIVQPCNCVTYRHSPSMARVHWFFRHPRHIQRRCSSYRFLSSPLHPASLNETSARGEDSFRFFPRAVYPSNSLPILPSVHFTSPRELVLFCIEYILRLRNENGTEINMQRLSFEQRYNIYVSTKILHCCTFDSRISCEL